MALHSDGDKHGWGSASLPPTHYGDTIETIAIAEKIAAELERLGVIEPGWSVPKDLADYVIGGAQGLIREPDRTTTPFDAYGRARIVPEGGDEDDAVVVRTGKRDVWIVFPESRPRRSMRVPLEAVSQPCEP